MKAVLVALACCACNQVYGIEEAYLRDAPPPDAPFECPPLGTTPVFSRYLHQIPLRRCSNYTLSRTGRAAALCRVDGPTFSSVLAEGAVDADLRPIVTPTVGSENYQNPRLSPDGERLYTQHFAGGVLQQELYTRQGDSFALTSVGAIRNGYLSTIATDPGGSDRVLINSANNFDEMVQTGGTWTVVTTHTPAELGLGTRTLMFPSLSFDGLRLVFTAQKEVGVFEYVQWYSDRTAVGLPFRAAEHLEGVPYTGSISVMSETCARVYIAGLDRTFYVQQR